MATIEPKFKITEAREVMLADLKALEKEQSPVNVSAICNVATVRLLQLIECHFDRIATLLEKRI